MPCLKHTQFCVPMNFCTLKVNTYGNEIVASLVLVLTIIKTRGKIWIETVRYVEFLYIKTYT